jgi:hypothetical protein
MRHLLPTLALSLALTSPALAASGPVVLELFTSQSCSSCPPADALLQKLASDPQVLALSYHVTYWDGAGWQDPFSRPASTDRQRAYAAVLGGGVYTPELVIDGRQQLIGSREGQVRAALAAAREEAQPVDIAMAAGPDHQLAIKVGGSASPADLWLVTYNPQAVTAVRGGENHGETLTSINNVTAITRLGAASGQAQSFTAPFAADPADRYAVLAQAPAGGPILGATVFVPPRT